RRGMRLGPIDPQTRPTLKDEVFGRHLQACELTCDQGDQLTRELRHFIQCAPTGSAPRVTGEAGRAAVALAQRILQTVRDPPRGRGAPGGLPTPAGLLLDSPASAAAGLILLPLPRLCGGEGRGEGVARRDTAPHPQPLSPQSRGEGRKAPIPYDTPEHPRRRT